MLKKTYIQPALEIMPLGMMVALCVSGESDSGIGGGGSGADPWGSHAPQRPVMF